MPSYDSSFSWPLPAIFVTTIAVTTSACSPAPPDSGKSEGSDVQEGSGNSQDGVEGSEDPAGSEVSIDSFEGEADSGVGADDEGEHADDGTQEGAGDGPGQDPRFDLGPIPDTPPHDGEGCEVDFLFVIDNSDSMKDEQDNLARSVPEFISAVQNRVGARDFHLGVVTTDAYLGNAPGCTGIGSLVTQTEGLDSSNAECGPFAAGQRFMTEADDLSISFPCAAKPGTWGDISERQTFALRRALSADLRAPGACNADFTRADALLVVTLISDEDDRAATGEPADWCRELIAAKGGVEEQVVLLSLIGLPEPNACPEWPVQAVEGVRLAELTRQFGSRGHLGDICLENYGPFFESALDVIDSACTMLPEG